MHSNNVFLKNGLVIDGTGKKEVENVHISIQNGKISSIIHNDYKADNSKYDRVIELDGLTILPGFINSHTHSGFKHLNGAEIFKKNT